MIQEYRHWWLGGLALLFIGASVGWFLHTHELKETDIPIGYSGEARRNDFLAAQRFLEAFDVPVTHIGNLVDFDKAPEGTDTIFLATHSQRLSGERLDQILRWVADGGHLITLSTGHEDSGDALAERLRVNASYPDEDDFTDSKEQDILESDDDTLMTINWLNSRLLDTQRRDALQTFTDDLGLRIVRLPHGDGSVTLSVSTRIFENDRIDEEDHAQLFWELITAGTGPNGRVAIVGGTDMPFILSLIWQHFTAMVIAATLLLTLWLVSRAQRFGPLLPEPPHSRRRILEHVIASSRFLWNREAATVLIVSMRAETLKTLNKRHPGIAQLPPAQRNPLLAKKTGHSQEQIESLLDAELPSRFRPDRFTELVRGLQSLRQS